MSIRVVADPYPLPLLVTRQQALAAGMSSGRIDHLIRSGRWRVVGRGRYWRVWEAEQPLQRHIARTVEHRHMAAAAALARRGSVVGGGSAALIHGMPLFTGVPHAVTLLVSPRGWTGRRGRVVSRRAALDPEDIVLVPFEGVGLIPVTSVSRTWFDIARTSSLGDALAVGDHARREGRLDEDRVGELIADGRAMRGIARARQAIGYCDPRRESPLESGSAAHFHLWGFPQPELQTEFFDSCGFVARTDFDWAAFDLVGEADGRVKYAGGDSEVRRAIRAEKWREARLRGLGKVVVRWGWDDAYGDGSGLRALLSPSFLR